MKQQIEIGRSIGPGNDCYIIAELSANHNQSQDQALELVRCASQCGADAVKLQTYTADTLTLNSDNECFRVQGESIWKGQKLYELYQQAHTPWEWHEAIRDEAHREGLDFFSTPFDPSSIQLLEGLDVPAYKIASFELVDHDLIRRVAQTGKPVIMSTGMASLAEIEEAVDVFKSTGNQSLVLLKCTSSYPARPEEMNLSTMPHLAETFGVPVGLSDHTLGVAVPIAAVALGACVIEKHFTLSREVEGPDSKFSLEPDEFAQMVEAVRFSQKAVGKVNYRPSAHEESSKRFRRSLFVVQDIKAGELFNESNVRSIRPSDGLAPKFLPNVIGRQARVDISSGTPLCWGLIKSKACDSLEPR